MIFLLNKLKYFTLILILLFGVNAFGIDESKPLFEQKPVQSLIQDYAHFLTPEQDQNLEIKLNQLSRETSTQILFVTVNDLLGYDKNDYATRLGKKWEVGGKANNGIVVLVQPKNASTKGEISIQVGYGLEGIIPDIVAKRIIEYDVLPYFKNEEYYEGVDAAINTLISLSKNEFTADDYLEKNANQNPAEWLPFLFFIGFFFFIIFLKFRAAKKYSIGHHLPFWLALSMLNSSSRSGSFSNFSSGSGSFGGGGFGGFGGGSFGGGGAGGSW